MISSYYPKERGHPIKAWLAKREPPLQLKGGALGVSRHYPSSQIQVFGYTGRLVLTIRTITAITTTAPMITIAHIQPGLTGASAGGISTIISGG